MRWLVPGYATLRKVLTNPLYAGAYVWGRSRSRVEYVDGKLTKRVTRRAPIEEARVFIQDHHEGYIPWKSYETIQAKIAENRAQRPMSETRGAIRKGPVLLAGLLRCGHCGRKLKVVYGTRAAVYACREGSGERFKRCLAIGTHGLDRAVGDELCRALEPVAVEAAVEAEALHMRDHQQVVEQAELRVQAAKYEADRAMEQYDQVDPRNRLVADTLEQRLDRRLKEHRAAQEELKAIRDRHEPLTEQQRNSLARLASDFPKTWNDPTADPTLRKKIARTAIEEAIVTHLPKEGCVEAVVRWRGGVHTKVRVHKRRVSRGSKADPSLVETVKKLAKDGVDDPQTARALNLNEIRTPRGLRWTEERVANFRRHHRIALGDPQKCSAYSAKQAASYLETSRSTIERLAELGLLSRNQALPYAPWRIARSELDSESVRRALERLHATGKLTIEGECSEGQASLFPEESTATEGVQE